MPNINIPSHLVNVDDMDLAFIDYVVERAAMFKRWRNLRSGFRRGPMENKLLITDFFEPSTRTRLSFEAAMSYLGGRVIGTENAAEFSSIKKGESIADNFHVISGYCDIIVGRFRNEGEARIAANASIVPLINGGDGTGEHPTQALIDYFTIQESLTPIDLGLITFIGDNKRSRTVKSLCKLLTRCTAVDRLAFVSPPGLEPEADFLQELSDQDIDHVVSNTIEPNLLEDSDVVYMTRAQNERGDEQFDGSQYALTPALADQIFTNAIIMHPLPRNSELPVEIDTNHRARYFEQAWNGLYVRMAILETLLG
jgi:aspartate carbamoyltransferase catalytic subunit